MTGRFCEVHGEYAPTGTCRWCEPPKQTPTNLSAGSTPCRCGEYAWLPGAVGERNGVIDGVAHSPEQCFKLDAEPPSSPTMYETTFTFTLTEEAYVWRLEWTEPVIDFDANAIQESLLADQHAALRWERVARRWATKAKFDGHERTVDGTLLFDRRCASCLRLTRESEAKP